MRTILAATDLSLPGNDALHRACRIASDHCAALVLLHVAPRALAPGKRAILGEELAEIAEAQALRHPCIQTVTSLVATGSPAEAIATTASDCHAELIVTGGHHASTWADELFGTAVERLIRHVTMPVLIVRQPAHHPYRRIVAAIDEGELAAETLDLAATIASAETLYSVHAFFPTMRQLVAADGDHHAVDAAQQDALERIVHTALGGRCDIAFKVHAISRRGDPFDVITEAQNEFAADLVVAVTHGRAGLALALHGSFADMLIEDAPFDVLIRHRH
jgi:nucleotide-binding universal stress UspA family protein